jgi:hypothetical protein
MFLKLFLWGILFAKCALCVILQYIADNGLIMRIAVSFRQVIQCLFQHKFWSAILDSMDS